MSGLQGHPLTSYTPAMAHPWHGHMTLQRRLELLAPLGFTLNPGRTVEELVSVFPLKKLESDPRMIFVALGGSLNGDDADCFCDALWHCDYECIEDEGDYARLANRIARLSRGKLVFTDVRDTVDIDNGKAELAFTHNGKKLCWRLKVDNDWADWNMFCKFDALGQPAIGEELCHLDFAQDAVFCWLTAEQKLKLIGATGLKWR